MFAVVVFGKHVYPPIAPGAAAGGGIIGREWDILVIGHLRIPIGSL